MTRPIENCPQGETPIRERAWTAEQEAARYATDLRHLIYLDTQFNMRGETDLKFPEMQVLEARGWIAEGEENGEYAVTEEGDRIIEDAIANSAPHAQQVEPAGWISDNDLRKMHECDDEARNVRISCSKTHLRVHPIFLRSSYAATLRQQATNAPQIGSKLVQGEEAGGRVSEDTVSMAYDAFLRLIGPDVHFALSRVPPIKAHQAMRAALEAVWKDIRNA